MRDNGQSERGRVGIAISSSVRGNSTAFFAFADTVKARGFSGSASSGFSVMVDLLLKVRRRARRIEEVPLVLRYDPSLDPVLTLGLAGARSLVDLRRIAVEDDPIPIVRLLARTLRDAPVRTPGVTAGLVGTVLVRSHDTPQAATLVFAPGASGWRAAPSTSAAPPRWRSAWPTSSSPRAW